MLVFYFSKQTSALAAHILLEEVGAAYEAREVSIPKGEHRAAAFLAVNPKARIPALTTPHGVLTENPAILAYIAETHPEAGLIPTDPFARAQAHAFNAYLCATVHVAFAHQAKGERWSDDPAVVEALKIKAPANVRDCAALIETHLLPGPWVLGEQYSLCDPYLFLMRRWMGLTNNAMEDFPKLAAHRDAMLARPATQRALAAHEP